MVIVNRVLYGDDARVCDWVKARMPNEAQRFGGFPEGERIGLGVVNAQGQLKGGVVAFHFRKHECSGALASDDPRIWTPNVLRQLFKYPFIQRNFARVTVYSGSENIKMHRLLLGVGFKQEGVLRRSLDGVQNLLVFGLLRDECRFLPKELNHDGCA